MFLAFASGIGSGLFSSVEELRSLVKVRNVWSPNMTSSVRGDLVSEFVFSTHAYACMYVYLLKFH